MMQSATRLHSSQRTRLMSEKFSFFFAGRVCGKSTGVYCVVLVFCRSGTRDFEVIGSTCVCIAV